MIGYGLKDSEVRSIDRRSSQTERLALAMVSTEEKFIGASPASTDVAAYLTYDPDTDTYPWFKIISDVNVAASAGLFVYFTPDGNRILAVY